MNKDLSGKKYCKFESNGVAWLLALLMLITASCNNATQTPDGGPCAYNHFYYPAVITEILELNNNYRDIILTLYMDGTTDTLYYSSEFPGYISKEELDSLGYKTGDTLTYEYMQITEGHCSPDIYVLRTERYGTQ
ncbi:MAG: hypothetical protein KIS94_07945 [Chitinophagales bacterium]|nr:hypothetical protein [Chitinophagales bacterium]